jgi:hypothetical protein
MMTEESKVPAQVKSQLALNVGHYAKVYAECRLAAKETLGPDATEDSILYATDTLFNQLCSDQVELLKDNKKYSELNALMKPLLGALERRGLYM